MTLKCSECGGSVTQIDANDMPNGHITRWECDDCGNRGRREVELTPNGGTPHRGIVQE